MYLKIKYLIVLLFIFFVNSCSLPQPIIVKAVQSDNLSTNFKLYYALPKTILKITIIQKHYSFIPGKFGTYAEHYFYSKPKSLLAKSSYKIYKILLTSESRFDSSRVFSISNIENIRPDIYLTNKGFLKGINIQAKNIQPNQKNIKKKINFTTVKNPDEKIPALPQEFFKQTTQAAKAAFLAKQIYTIREDRHYLAVGESSNNQLPDGLSLKEMLSYLTNLESQYLALYYGTEKLEYDTLNFEYEPHSKSGEQQILFRFSNSEGVVPTTNIDAYPVFIDINLNSNSEISRLEERTNIVRQKNHLSDGLNYCIPANAHIIIRDEEIELFSTNMPIAQLGTLAVLPFSYFNSGISVYFNPDLGSILNLMELYKE